MRANRYSINNHDKWGLRAINHGKPLIRDKKTHPLVGQILSLVGEIRERVVNGELKEGEQ